MSGRGIFGEAAGRRRYVKPSNSGGARCEDCGQYRPYTEVRFWTTGMRYRVCSDCIKPYRAVILHPDPEWRRA